MPGLDTSALPTARSSPVPGSISSSCRVPRSRSRSSPTVTLGFGMPTLTGSTELASFRDDFVQVRESFVSRAIPAKSFGESPAPRPEHIDQIRRLHQSPHGRGHRLGVVLRNQKSGLAIYHRFTDTRRVHCN